ncbi:MAG: hypothetical protein C4530_10450 [Desulfobacteraceae bacterium]|nr:MAG: hypothetical protein C4530_10450 [Desulfobacteraceae bacterium]
MTNRTDRREETMEESTKEMENPLDRFYSVEFSIHGLNLLYQSRIWMGRAWSNAAASMFALVKENSNILDWLQVGDVLNMKYYSNDSMCPTRNFDTKIEYITRDQNGRFKGHYLVGLEILTQVDRARQPLETGPQRVEWGHGVREKDENRTMPVFETDARVTF